MCIMLIHLQILHIHTHTHTRQESSSQSALSEPLRSEGTQSKEGNPVLPVRVGESELTPGNATSTSSQRGWAIFHLPPPTALTSSTQPLTCPHHSDTLPPSPASQDTPARAPSSSATVVDISVTVPSCSFGFPPTPWLEEGFPWPPHLYIKAPPSLDLCS